LLVRGKEERQIEEEIYIVRQRKGRKTERGREILLDRGKEER